MYSVRGYFSVNHLKGESIAIHNTPAPKKHSPATKYTPYRPPAAVLLHRNADYFLFASSYVLFVLKTTQGVL